MKGERWRWLVMLLLVGGYFIPFTLLKLREPEGATPALSRTSNGLIIAAGVQLLLFGVVLAVAWVISRARRRDFFLTWPPRWWVIPIGFAYSIAMRLAAVVAVILFVIALRLSGLFNTEQLGQFGAANVPRIDRLVDTNALATNSTYYWLTITLISFVVAGLREELWRAGTLAALRHLWPNTFETTKGQYFAVVLIAIVFGALHYPLGPIAAVMAGILGICLGIIMVFHQSIWPAILAHGFVDATSFALIPFVLQRLPHAS